MALTTVSSDRLAQNVKNTNFTSAEKQDLTDDIKPLLGSSGGGNKNLVINGAMQVAQRGTSSTDLYYQTVDRMRTSFGNLGSINVTQSQQQLTSSDTPYSSGFRYFYRAALSGAGSVNSNGYLGISQRLEARDIATSGWDYTSTSSDITIQFWFRCSTNQTFYMALTSQDGTQQSYVFSFTATGNNTWTKVTKTIPGAANVQFDTDTEANAQDRGLTISFTPWYGTDYTGSKAVNQWSAYSGSAEYPDYASTWLTAGASTFDITGVQLEIGSVATDFEHLSYSEDLRKCQRYYEETYVMTDAGNSYVRMYALWKVEKRANGTSTAYALRPDGTGTGSANKAYQASGEPSANCNYPWTGGTMIQVSGYSANTDLFANIRCDAEI